MIIYIACFLFLHPLMHYILKKATSLGQQMFESTYVKNIHSCIKAVQRTNVPRAVIIIYHQQEATLLHLFHVL